jgi:hypothetical protein
MSGKYFPYGEDRYSPYPANPANGQEQFATYRPRNHDLRS